MKKLTVFLLILALLLSGCGESALPEVTTQAGPCIHEDIDINGICDLCFESCLVVIDFYNINDLHGKITDGDGHPGVDELTTYLSKMRFQDDHVVLLSSGDMWQGAAESNMTRGLMVTDWMNTVGFTAMTLGNHEFDWGEAAIEENAQLAEFPLLAINIYDRETDERVSYCEASTLVEFEGVQVGIIGAMGDCYNSIAVDKTEGVYFLVEEDLTRLVMAESDRLREAGADIIVYVIHDGYGESGSASPTHKGAGTFSPYYDIALSDGYVDLVFEAHTHQRYMLLDDHGVYHLQGGGDNRGITHVELEYNTALDILTVSEADLLPTGEYALMDPDPVVETLLEKYEEQIAPARETLGKAGRRWSKNEIRQLVAELYYEAGVAKWGDAYDIVLGGGFISCRAPGEIPPGDVQYALLQGILPFDNELRLCSISGRDLREKFFETDHSSYFIAYGDYGASVRNNIDPDATYYIVTDTYSSLYGPNNITEIADYDEGIYARDLIADYIRDGRME